MANLIRYNPFSEVVSLREAMDRLFEDSFIPRGGVGGHHAVTSNLYETADNFVLQIPMPGANPNSVEITTQHDVLHITWDINVAIPENASTHWSAFASGHFQQSFTLPAAINSEKAEASFDDGILTLTLPKAEHAKARTLKITSKK